MMTRTTGAQEWRTPHWLWRYLNSQYAFCVDAAATRRSRLVPTYFGPDHRDRELRDATLLEWVKIYGRGPYFLNPPFQNIMPFLQRAAEASMCGAIVVCLLPARTDVLWFHEVVLPYAREVRFVKGRVRYYYSTTTGKPNFPSMVVVFGPGLPKERALVGSIER